MNKPYDYEELWDSFTVTERKSILTSTWTGCHADTSGLLRISWNSIPKRMHEELLSVDWEFALGRRLRHPDVY